MRVTRVTNQVSMPGLARSSRLRVIDGPDAGLEADLPPIGAVLGAERGSDVVLTDPSVSRRHCSVVPTATGFAITDLGSRNGTTIDGVAITKVTAPPGVAVRLGKTLIQLLPADEPVAIPPSTSDHFGAMFGDSPAMRQVFAVLERAARSDAPILFLGESGTGKELAARAVHDASPRKDGPFVVFDCGASTETLIESDLFGHVRGAFTGAAADRQGAFAAADGGTLFLDEIGELELPAQPRLLRAIERRQVKPIGATTYTTANVRVVAATNRDLLAEVKAGRFREDLYHRLAVMRVVLPPLRERREDIPQLVSSFLEQAAQGSERRAPIIPPETMAALRAHDWPGNVRELRNVRALAMALAPEGSAVDEHLLGLDEPRSADTSSQPVDITFPFKEAKDRLVLAWEREYVQALLAKHEGNVS